MYTVNLSNENINHNADYRSKEYIGDYMSFLGVCLASSDLPSPRGGNGPECCAGALWPACPGEAVAPTQPMATHQSCGWPHPVSHSIDS